MKSRRGSRKLDLSAVRAATLDRRAWVGLGIVYLPSGEQAHWEVDADIGVLVHVLLMPDQEPLLCRLGGLGEGGANGVWRVPPVGSEVAIMVPAGDIESDTMIVGVLSSGGTPAELDADTLVVRAPKITIIADGAVEVGGKDLDALLDGVVHGRGIDPLTGQTYSALGSTSSTLRTKK